MLSVPTAAPTDGKQRIAEPIEGSAVLSAAAESPTDGVVIIVGGPQYRVRSHRQFVQLAWRLADEGAAVLRFDYRGMGDSSGALRNFENVEPDIRAAIDTLLAHCPSVTRVTLWGLCDAASAAMMYAPGDPRVHALALANPWARSDDTYARAQLKNYYLRRLLSADFWRKLLSGHFSARAAAGDLRNNLVHAAGSKAPARDYRQRMTDGLHAFRGRVLLLISGADLTASEFLIYMQGSPQRRALLADARITRVDFEGADHTFSQLTWQRRAEEATVRWLQDGHARAASPRLCGD